MMYDSFHERGTMQPKKNLSTAQLREIGDTVKQQAEEYYALADEVSEGYYTLAYNIAVAKYFGDKPQ